MSAITHTLASNEINIAIARIFRNRHYNEEQIINSLRQMNFEYNGRRLNVRYIIYLALSGVSLDEELRRVSALGRNIIDRYGSIRYY